MSKAQDGKLQGIKEAHAIELPQADNVRPKHRSESPAILTPEEIEASTPALLKTISGHFVSMSLNALVRLGLPDALGSEHLTVRNIYNIKRFVTMFALSDIALHRSTANSSGRHPSLNTPISMITRNGGMSQSLRHQNAQLA